MRVLALLVGLLLGVGCQKEATSLVRLAEDHAGQVCACPDAACANDKVRDYVRAVSPHAETAAGLSRAEEGALREAVAKLGACLREKQR
jgi:hypothetical protein